MKLTFILVALVALVSLASAKDSPPTEAEQASCLGECTQGGEIKCRMF
jgi:hypothetical protein